MTLACASCGTSVPESEIDPTTGVARCLACGTTFSRYAPEPDASQCFLPDPASAPDGVSFRYLELGGASSPGAHYRQQARGAARFAGVDVRVSMPLSEKLPVILLLAPSMVAFVCIGTLIANVAALMSGSPWLQALAAYGWIPVLLAALYTALAFALRRPRLRLDANGLRVRMGRLPWWGDRTLALESLLDIHPVHWEEIIRDRRGRERGRVTRYAIDAALSGDRRRRLVKLDERAQYVGSMLGEVLRELKG